jgi:hypothetical protein
MLANHRRGRELPRHRHEAVAHHRAAAPRGADAAADIGAADGVEHMVDAIGLQGAGQPIDPPGRL